MPHPKSSTSPIATGSPSDFSSETSAFTSILPSSKNSAGFHLPPSFWSSVRMAHIGSTCANTSQVFLCISRLSIRNARKRRLSGSPVSRHSHELPENTERQHDGNCDPLERICIPRRKTKCASQLVPILVPRKIPPRAPRSHQQTSSPYMKNPSSSTPTVSITSRFTRRQQPVM